MWPSSSLRNRRGSGVVIEGTVPRAAILGYITEREEVEVILSTNDLEVEDITSPIYGNASVDGDGVGAPGLRS